MTTARFALPAAAGIVCAGLSACGPVSAAPASPAQAASPMSASGSAASSPRAVSAAPPMPAALQQEGQYAGVSNGPGSYLLQAMPAGAVSFRRGPGGQLHAQVDMFGLTPGSSHAVSAAGAAGPAVQFPVLTAGPGGQADATLTAGSGTRRLPPGSRLVVRLGTGGTDPLAAEPIAESPVLPPHPPAGSVFPLHAVTAVPGGGITGRPAGSATITYNPVTQTLTVTVTASALTPGPHAAHIHQGTCRNQGPVAYMLADFTADANGNINHETRTVAGVTSIPGPGAWYLNLHQGGAAQIIAAGAPTPVFRPLLCADITSVAMASGSPSPAPPASAVPASAPGAPSASGTGSAQPALPGTASPGATATGTATAPAIPSLQPTHW